MAVLGHAADQHPGTHTLYNTNLHARTAGTFRARFGVVYEEKQPDGR